MNSGKKPANGTRPFCQTISVVMSPNGLKAPPALAATTMLMQATATNFGLSCAHGDDDGAHHQGRGQVVRDRRDDEGQRARHPEEGAQREASVEQPDSQGVEDAPLLHRVDEGHGNDQEQEDLGEIEQVVPKASSAVCVSPSLGIEQADEDPDEPRADEDGDRLAEVEALFEDDQRVGDPEDTSAAIPTQWPVRSSIVKLLCWVRVGSRGQTETGSPTPLRH